MRDVQSTDANIQCVGLELGAVAARTFLGGLILAQKNPDVLLVSLVLEVFQKRKDSLITARSGVEQQLPLRGGELIPRFFHRDSLALRELGE